MAFADTAQFHVEIVVDAKTLVESATVPKIMLGGMQVNGEDVLVIVDPTSLLSDLPTCAEDSEITVANVSVRCYVTQVLVSIDQLY